MKRTMLLVVGLFAGLSMAQVVGAPTVGPAPKWSPAVPEVRSLQNGAKLRVLTRKGLPLTSVVVFVPAGTREETAAQSGLSSLTAELLHEGGAGTRAPNDFLEAIEGLGAEVDVRASREGVTFSITVISSRFEAAMGLLLDMLVRPKFDATAFDSLKQRRLAEIASSLDEPRVIASRTLYAALYGDAPEGRPGLGTVQAVTGLTLDDVKAFHAAHYASAGMTFVLAGDLTADAVKQKLDALAPKAWGKAGAVKEAVAPAAQPAKWLAVDKKDAPQTQVLLARPGQKVLGERFATDELAAKVLGGSFTSRLNQNLREKHGYTYGASVRNEAGKAGGSLVVGTAVKREVTADALEQLMLELKGITTITREEMAKAQALQRAEFVDAFGTGSMIAGTFAQDVLDGLGPDGLAKEFAAIESASFEGVQAAAKDFAPEGFTVVLVGDRAVIEPALKKKFPGQAIEWVPAPK